MSSHKYKFATSFHLLLLSRAQRQDNIKILLNILESTEFYLRLYSIQLITAIFASRPERTQECVLNAALGTSRLVSTLDDPRDAVRNGIFLWPYRIA
jgi:intracellular protein transport protein USO1